MTDRQEDVTALVEQEVETYSGFLADDHPEFREYLREETLAEMEEREDPVSLADAVQEAGQDAVKHFREDHEQVDEVFRDVRSEAVWDDAVMSVYKEEMLKGVAVAAADYLNEQGVEVEEPRDVALRFSPSTGSYDWQNDVVRIGEQEPKVDYKPGMFGLMAHELYHKKQFADKVAAGVEQYNEIAASTDALDEVAEGDEDYHSYGLMMQGRGEMVEQLVEEAEATGSAEAERYLRDAIEQEVEAFRYEPADPYEIEQEGRHVDLFGPEDEIVPHEVYLEAEGVEDPDEVERYLTEVVRENKGGDMIEREMRDRMS